MAKGTVAIQRVPDSSTSQAASASAGTNDIERKRKRRSDNDVVFVRKRYKKEIDFHAGEVEENLRRAGKKALARNKKMMQFNIDQAMEHAREAGAVNAHLDERIRNIRAHLNDEGAYHTREVEEYLQRAEKRALAGNKMMMQINIDQAMEHAREARAVNAHLDGRIRNIRAHLNDEGTFHTREVEKYLKRAEKRAQAGNKRIMQINIDQAMEHAREAGAVNAHLDARIRNIRAHLNDEGAYHTHELEENLTRAEKKAHSHNSTPPSSFLGWCMVSTLMGKDQSHSV